MQLMTKKPKESKKDRLERIRLNKVTSTKVIPDKTKYNRKKINPVDRNDT